MATGENNKELKDDGLVNGIVDNFISIICFVAAKILGMIAVGCAYAGNRNAGLALFLLAFCALFVAVVDCARRMKFARNLYGENPGETSQ